MKEVEFESEGQKIVGFLYLPKKQTKKAIIFLHGFGGRVDRAFFKRASRIFSRFSEGGFAVLMFLFRSYGRSEGRFEDLTITSQIADTKSAIDFMQRQGYEKIGVVGLSLGGSIGILTAVEDKRINVLVSLASPARFSELWTGQQIKEMEEKGFVYIGNRKIKKTFLDDMKKYLPARAVEKISAPFLIIHSDSDEILPVSHAKDLYKFAKEPKRLEIIKGADHSFSKSGEKEVISLTLEWFKRWL